MAKPANLQECFTQIEAAIEDLEDGDLPLEEAFQRYEHGLRHLQTARKQLDAFQRRFEELRGDEATTNDPA